MDWFKLPFVLLIVGLILIGVFVGTYRMNNPNYWILIIAMFLMAIPISYIANLVKRYRESIFWERIENLSPENQNIAFEFIGNFKSGHPAIFSYTLNTSILVGTLLIGILTIMSTTTNSSVIFTQLTENTIYLIIAAIAVWLIVPLIGSFVFDYSKDKTIEKVLSALEKRER
ncbi:MAG: hypothetical protein NT016_01245 [Candidatus Aenigmarchaeota archaeon]|nr:hypothetical protein [Candidatus Aenigmarchaeota archaeon]